MFQRPFNSSTITVSYRKKQDAQNYVFKGKFDIGSRENTSVVRQWFYPVKICFLYLFNKC